MTKKRVRGERQRLQDVQWRQRKKQERQQLKDMAQQLETQLSQLQQDKERRSPPASPSSIKQNKIREFWQKRAETRNQEQVEAELLNLTLRRAVAYELRVAKSLRTTMQRRPHMPRSVMHDMRRASCSPTETQAQNSQCSQCCNPTSLHINPATVRREIEATLQRMHEQAVVVLNSSAANDSLSFTFNVRLDPVAAPTVEVTMSVPMNCAVNDAVKLLGPKCRAWGPGDVTGSRCVPEPRRCGGLPNEQQFTVELGAPFKTVLLDGFGSTRKIDDEYRRMILWAALSFDRCGALCFRERTWLAVYRSPSNPANESMVRIYHSVAAEKAGGCAVIDGENINKKLLAKNDIFKDIEFAFESQPMLDQSLTAAHTANFVLAEITKSMDPMYLQSNAVFPDLMGRSTATLESYKKCHEMCGIISDNCIETISVTPVPCTIAESWSMLWHQLVSRKNVEPDKLYRFIRVKETSLEMSFTLPLRGENLQLLRSGSFELVVSSSKHVTGQSSRRPQAIH
ncbi:uncharacterized protein KRP23_15158 [Phytophthora ramorum]|uniref:uncharacterized protein n=1 Tax=Phytophthora ramorum TaxID=164328 RepID=UPI0030AD37CB|nr:hypothetical protein KRP23_15158 [Phytophthora ramorum]